jgi:FkbM family methyltransferase
LDDLVRHAFTRYRYRNSFLVYLSIRPADAMSALRLGIDYLASLLTKLLFLRGHLKGRFFPGSFVFGSTELKVQYLHLRFYVRPRSNDIWILSGLHEPRTASIFNPKGGQVFIDVGAHLGRYTLLAAKSGARVIAIEPNPDSLALLEKNVTENGLRNVSCLGVALAEKPDTRQLHFTLSDTAISSLHSDWPMLLGKRMYEKSIMVKCETLDELVVKFGVKKIDWLKIDVEGSEVEVLEGGRRALGIVSNLILEVTRGNEDQCLLLTGRAGLRVLMRESGADVSNWYLKKTIN